MELPLFFLKIINPADVYFRRQAPKSVGPVFRGGAVYGPEGGRQATEEEIRAFGMRREAADPGTTMLPLPCSCMADG